MCEFCTEHGEGKKWYLLMKNYSEELLHADLDRLPKRIGRVENRLQWNQRFFEHFVLPASQGIPPTHSFITGEPLVGPGDNAEHPARPRADEKTELAIGKMMHFGQVVPMEDVDRILDMSDSITRIPCGCRFLSTGKTDKRYCFGLGIDRWGLLGKFPDAASSLEVLDKEEAKKIIRSYDADGLIHSVWTGITPYIMGLCNCDHDCLAYRGYIEEGGTPDFFRGEDVGEVDPELCTGCKSCVSQCQFGAMNYSAGREKVHINARRCFGCGVCRAACPNGAITLLPREQVPAAAGLWLKETSA